MSGHARSRRSLAAAILALPLAGVPIAAPAVAVVGTVDVRAYGANAVPGQDAAGLAAKQRATRASAQETKGVVLIDTVVDYGLGRAAGTGLVITHNGLVVTNHHVVEGATSIAVKVPGGRRYTATVVGYDAGADIAVLRLQGASRLRTVTTHAAIGVGQPIEAVGNAAGLGRLTAAPGQVLRRGVTVRVRDDFGGQERLVGLIKDSADVVPGDSGGAVLDRRNRVVGMNVAASIGTKDVVGFAIPIGQVTRVAGRIVSGRAGSAIVIGPRATLGISIKSNGPIGLIAAVVTGGPADRAGLAPGDVITSIDGSSLGSNSQLTTVLAGKKVGQQVTVGYTDAHGAPQTATVTLWAGPVG